MINAECRVCRSGNSFREYEVSNNRDNNLCSLYICSNCFVLYNTALDSKSLSISDFEQMQGEVVQNHYATGFSQVEHLEQEVQKSQSILNFLFSSEGLLNGNDTFIEIGCGAGFLAAAAASRFKKVYASDLDTSLTRHTVNVLGLKNVSVIEDFEAMNDRADVAVLWHTLEHIHNPADFILKVKHKLKKDGLIFIQVPLYRKEYYVDSHLWFFNAATVSVIKKVYGFEKSLVSFDPVNSYLTFCLSKPIF